MSLQQKRVCPLFSNWDLEDSPVCLSEILVSDIVICIQVMIKKKQKKKKQKQHIIIIITFLASSFDIFTNDVWIVGGVETAGDR